MIRPLIIQLRRILDDREINLQDLAVAKVLGSKTIFTDSAWPVVHVLTVSPGRVLRATDIAGRCADHARDVLEHTLHTLEAS